MLIPIGCSITGKPELVLIERFYSSIVPGVLAREPVDACLMWLGS
ncbi:MAG TPA: hypothetical protein VFA85_09295 [Terriglobales bacterium]|nr:hypothetical protein [Terriglobales bacterium]